MKKLFLTLGLVTASLFGYTQLIENDNVIIGNAADPNTSDTPYVRLLAQEKNPWIVLRNTKTVEGSGPAYNMGIKFETPNSTNAFEMKSYFWGTQFLTISRIGENNGIHFFGNAVQIGNNGFHAVNYGLRITPTTSQFTGHKRFFDETIIDNLKIGNQTINPDNQNICKVSGAMTIGWITDTPAGYGLYVSRGILTEKVKVAVRGTANWADFVFDKSYKLRSLYEVESFINKNKHLPDVPSAEDMVENGLDVVATDALLLQKIEELTLYMIQQQKEIDKLKKELVKVKNK